MEDRIASQVKDRKPEEVEELNLDNVRCSKVSGLTEEYTHLKHLSIINAGLTTLEGLPPLPALEKLELGDNKLTGSLDHLTYCPSLKHLSLVGNRVAAFDDIKPLCGLLHLSSLDLLDCPLTQHDGYRDQVFNLLPSLSALDGLTREGEEVEESGSEEEEEEEEEEAEGDGDSEGSDEVGLDYLTRELGSDSSGDSEDYDPNAEVAPDDDDIIRSSGEEGEDGPSSAKKPRLEPPPNPPPDSSDSD